jgi:hypothetical protein
MEAGRTPVLLEQDKKWLDMLSQKADNHQQALAYVKRECLIFLSIFASIILFIVPPMITESTSAYEIVGPVFALAWWVLYLYGVVRFAHVLGMGKGIYPNKMGNAIGLALLFAVPAVPYLLYHYSRQRGLLLYAQTDQGQEVLRDNEAFA